MARTSLYAGADRPGMLISILVVWIFCSKMVKIAPHFKDHPSDLVWLPGYLAYAYWHSLVKLYCGLTLWDHTWNGRNLALAEMESVENMERENLLDAYQV